MKKIKFRNKKIKPKQHNTLVFVAAISTVVFTALYFALLITGQPIPDFVEWMAKGSAFGVVGLNINPAEEDEDKDENES